MTDSNSFRNHIAGTAPGAEVTLTVVRDNREQQVRATLGELKAEAGKAQGGSDQSAGEGGKLGISVEPLTPELASRLKLPQGVQGLVIASVDPSGPAADAGLQQGDVIEEANRQPVRSVADLTAAIGRAGARPLLLLINRDGQDIFVTVHARQ